MEAAVILHSSCTALADSFRGIVPITVVAVVLLEASQVGLGSHKPAKLRVCWHLKPLCLAQVPHHCHEPPCS